MIFILGILFLIICFITFTLPAQRLLKIIKFEVVSPIENFFLSTVIGIVGFTLIAYILAALHLRILMYLIPLVGLWSKAPELRSWSLRFFSLPKLTLVPKSLVLIFIIGIIGQVVINAPSGWMYEDGLYFYSSHGHDGVWHLALMEEMKRPIFPFQNPEYAGHQLQNYHFFVDLLMSEMSRLFYFSNLDVYFRFMPVVFSLLLGLGSYLLVTNWTGDKRAGWWAVFFTYFAGSFGFILTLIRDHKLGGESIFWVSQTQSVLGNPPHAAAFVILIAVLILLLKFFRADFKWPVFVLIAVLGGALIEFKVYAGVLLLGGLLVVGLWELMKRRQPKPLYLFGSTLLVAMAIYLPNSSNSQDFLIWQPWWFIRTMVVAGDRLDWLDLELRRQTYIAEHNWKRVIQLETTALLIFMVGNLGMRFLGFLTFIRKIKSMFSDNFDLCFMAMTTASFLIPVFFLQKGVAWNVIQFEQYFLLLFGFLAAISVNQFLNWIKKVRIRNFITVVIIILALPTQIGLLQQFYGNLPLSKISFGELEGLKYLQDNTSIDDIILTAPFSRYARDSFGLPPVPISSWYETGYVPAFSGRRTLISDHEQLDIMGYQIKSLLTEREQVFKTPDNSLKNDFLKKYQIGYIYLAPKQQFATTSADLQADIVFSNNDVQIYKVRFQP